MHRGAVLAAVQARGHRGGEFALGAAQPALGVVEDVQVRQRAGFQRLRVAREQAEVLHVGALGLDQRVDVLVGQLALFQRRHPRLPAQRVRHKRLGRDHLGLQGRSGGRPAGVRNASSLLDALRHLTAPRQHTHAVHDTQLERHKGDELTERDNRVLVVAHLLQVPDRCGRGVLRVEGQQVGEVEGDGECVVAEGDKVPARVRAGGHTCAHRVFDHGNERLVFVGKQVRVELRGTLCTGNAGDEGGDGIAGGYRQGLDECRVGGLKQGCEAALGVFNRFGSAAAQVGKVGRGFCEQVDNVVRQQTLLTVGPGTRCRGWR